MELRNSLLIIIFSFLSFYLFGCTNLQYTNQSKEAATMKKKIVNPWTWQDKYGFVQGNEVTDVKRTLYTAGIVSVDADGNLLHSGDMKNQINQIFDNMEVLVKQANFKLSDVVRFTYYTTDVQAFINAGQVLGERLEKARCRPATSLIGVSSLFHPDCVVEIEAVLVK
jgi:enamine deaminase RidA (YjgF/YER057c/UK114 family)